MPDCQQLCSGWGSADLGSVAYHIHHLMPRMSSVTRRGSEGGYTRVSCLDFRLRNFARSLAILDFRWLCFSL